MIFRFGTWLWNMCSIRLEPTPSLQLMDFYGEEKLSKVKFALYDFLRNSHVWGAPTYVSDPKLQDGEKVPKISPHSLQGHFLGFSKEHSSSMLQWS